MDIVFNVNPLGLEGRGVTLVSLLRHCSNPARLHLRFLSSALSASDKDNVRELLAREQFGGQAGSTSRNGSGPGRSSIPSHVF